MKFVLILAAIIVSVIAAPAVQNPDKDAIVLRFDNDNSGLGQYNFNVETSDGQYRQEQAELKNAGSEQQSIAVRGSYSYTIDGVTYTVNYVADENGFQPEGAHLPKNVQL